MIAIEKRVLFSELDLWAREVSEALTKPFVMWLEAEMGSGKTTFVRHFLYQRGLAKSIPVTSPTYTLFNEYAIGEKHYAHLDLYRGGEDFSWAELGVLDRNYEGIFLEWPHQVKESLDLAPTHRLQIKREGEELRLFQLFELP